MALKLKIEFNGDVRRLGGAVPRDFASLRVEAFRVHGIPLHDRKNKVLKYIDDEGGESGAYTSYCVLESRTEKFQQWKMCSERDTVIMSAEFPSWFLYIFYAEMRFIIMVQVRYLLTVVVYVGRAPSVLKLYHFLFYP